MLVQSLKFIQQYQGNIHNISIYGQEKNPTTWKLDVAENKSRRGTWSEISIVLNGENDKKTKIEICSQINRQYLGNLLKQLELDPSFRRREDLFANNGDLLSKITSHP